MISTVSRVIRASAAYRIWAAIGAFFSGMWTGSGLLGAFLRAPRDTVSCVPGRAIGALRRVQVRVFHALRLDKALRGSMFSHPEWWCALALFASPIVPTMLAAALLAAALFSVFMTFGARAERKITPHPANKYILLYIFVYAASIFTSVTVSGSLQGGALMCFFTFAAIIVQSAVRTRRDVTLAVTALIGGGLLVAAYGVYQYVFGASAAYAWQDPDMFGGMVRIYSTLDNPNVLAEYLLLVIPFCGAGLIASKTMRGRLFCLASLGACALAMVLTFSRGGWLGLIFAAAVFLLMIDRRFVFLGIAGLAALYFLLPPAVLERFASIGNLEDGSTSYRVFIWMGTISALREYWFVGFGPGTAAFNRVYPKYAYNSIVAPHSHNLFLQIVCDSGITALVLMLLLLFSVLRRLAASLRRDGRASDRALRMYRIAGISAICGFAVQSMTDYSFYNYRVALMFWAVVGLSMALSGKFEDAA
ncbi:MAG: O-antigen ligase family protein [Oscillospiraceae bacterium]|jgi:O-antigen ligase|nr:O-antigen ligase family protein [Oscillospiraceae bacterium]